MSYQSPQIQKTGGDDTQPVASLALAWYAVKYAAAINVAAVANVAVGANTFALWNWAWFWNNNKKPGPR